MQRSVRSLVAVLFTVATASALVAATGAPVGAEPSVAEAEKQLDSAWNRLESIIERHNAVKQDLARKKRQAEGLRKKIEPLQIRVDLAMNQVGAFAAEYYKGGPPSTVNALLSGGSPTAFADRLTLLDMYAKEQQQRVQTVVDLKARYDGQKRPLDVLVAQLAATERSLAAQQRQIDSDIDRLQQLRLAAFGDSADDGPTRPVPCPYDYIGGAGGAAAKFACAQIGKPYVWGADGPGSYDCSGLTMSAWGSAGVGLPHNAARQRAVTAGVSRSDLRPGDLVFYYGDLHHVALYVGHGWVVHAPTSGDVVRMRKIDLGPVHSYGRPG